MPSRLHLDDATLRALADSMGGADSLPESPAPPAASPARRPSAFWPMLAAGAGDLGDIVSQQLVFKHGGGEANPLLPHTPLPNALALGGEAVITQLLIHKLMANHPTLARTLGYGVGALGGINTARNLHNATLWAKETGR